MRPHGDTLILVVLSVASLGAALATLFGVNGGVVGAILGTALVLVSPGFALTAAARNGRVLGGVEQALFSIGMSFVTAILGGLALYGAGVDLYAGWWALFLALVTLGASAVAIVERRRRGDVERAGIGGALPPLRELAMWGLAGAITVAAVLVALRPAPPDAVEGYTQLWILPASDRDEGEIVLGVRSMELTTVAYSLQLEVQGTTVQDWGPVELEPGQTWQQSVALPMSRSEAGSVVAALYRLDDADQVYRRVVLRGGM